MGRARREFNVSSGAQVNFTSTEHLAALNISAGAIAMVQANGSRVLVTKALGITGTGKLDLTETQ